MKPGFAALVVAVALAGCHPSALGPSRDRGHHLATVMGCTSCHGAKLDGHLFEEDPTFVLAWSSNLSRILPHWSDAEITAALRTGKRPDGSALWFMPTFAQRHLSDDDTADLIGWLRSVPPSGTDHPVMKRGPRFAEAVAHGFSDSAAQAKRLAGREPIDAGPAHARGRYLATVACAECHGPDLKGSPDPRPGDPPDLTIAAAYSVTDFARLLKTGVARNGKPAGEMAEEARKRLSALEAGEVSAIRRYLLARANAAGISGSGR